MAQEPQIIEGDLLIYRITDDGNLETIVTMPIQQDIPKAESKTTFHIVPQENIELVPGEYYISFALTEIAQDIKDRWADSSTWTDAEKYARMQASRLRSLIRYHNLYLPDNQQTTQSVSHNPLYNK